MRWRRILGVGIGALFAVAVNIPAHIYAQQSQSSNYQVNEVIFGTGGELNACSSSYCSKQAAGEIAAGNTAGNVFKAQAGFNTDRQPYLAFSVAGNATDLGTLSSVATAHTTATFAVKTYLSNGYVVQFSSDPPTNNGPNTHQMSTMATPAASSIGTEQFGLNLVQNRTNCATPAPGNFGNDPVQVPDNTFSNGTVASDYATCGLFKYLKGDTVATSSQSSGETDYTVSFIYNISSLTPDGYYNFNGTLVATSTY
ncbi:MAG TPA: hypothetical protein VMR45_02420 [Patescibacteria group bacterium]|nr:hypothetical protein [Patescibacteria group bacterium]